MASLNPFRRREPTLLASSENINLGDERAVAAVLKRQEGWQRQAADANDASSLIYFGTTQIADLMSGLVLFAAEQPTDKDAKPERSSDAKEIETVERLGNISEIGQLLYDLTALLVLVGEVQLLGLQPALGRAIDQETWVAYSHLELESAQYQREDGTYGDTVRIPEFRDGLPLTINPELGDTWIRIWRPNPFRRYRATSHIKPLLSTVDELVWWELAAAAVAKNRLVTAGLIGLPSNLELPPEAGEPANLSGSQRFSSRFLRMAVKILQSPGSAGSAVPAVFTYPWNESGKSGVEVINFERPQDRLLSERVEYCQKTISQGFPLPPETFFGIGDAAYGQGRQITENKFQEHVEPFTRFLFAALTQAWYRPILKKEGVKDYEKKILWYDASNLIVHPDMPQAADKGYEFGLVSGSAWRRIRGVSERDAPTEDEREEALEWLKALRGKGQGDGPDAPDDEPTDDNTPPTDEKPLKGHPAVEKNGAPVRGKGQPVLASADSNGHSSLGRRLAEIDADLLSRVQVMADSAMRREQERAGNKLKLRASKNTRIKATIKGVSATDIAATLGRETVITLGLNDLFTDSFENVPEMFIDWCDTAIIAAFSEAALNPKDYPAFALSYQPVEGADLLVRELKELAAILLFDRSSVLDIGPEADGLLVPAHVVRSALALSGGASSGNKTSLLLATGHAVTKTLAAAGQFTDSYQWWYPPSGRNPFAAHQSLDGTSFQLDSSVHLPGDEKGCRCLAVPLFK